MSAAKHAPEPWAVDSWFVRRSCTVHWVVRRRVVVDGRSDVEYMENAAGRVKRFRSELTASAAAAKANGGQQ